MRKKGLIVSVVFLVLLLVKLGRTYKTRTLSSFFLVMVFFSVAQPSDEVILKRLRDSMDQVKGISMELNGKRGSVRREVENGVPVSNFYRNYDYRFRTEHPGVTGLYRGVIKYGFHGDEWVYVQKLVGDYRYFGIDNPSWSKINPIITKDRSKTIGPEYSNIVGEIADLRLSSEPDWKWHTLSSVEFTISMVYSLKTTYTELEKVRQEFKIRLYADAYKGPWKDYYTSTRGETESLGTSSYSAEEMLNMKTLQQLEVEEKANAELASLPKVKIPFFKNHEDLNRYLHELLMTADGQMIEANLRQLLSSFYFNSPKKIVLNNRGKDLIGRIKREALLYRKQYCNEMSVKHSQPNMLQWYNKDQSGYSRVSSNDIGDGNREIVQIALGIKPDSGGELASKQCKARSNPLVRMKKTSLNTSPGSYVFSNYGSSEWSYVGTLGDRSGNSYIINWLDGSKSSEPASSVCNYGLKSGDEAHIKNSRGDIVPRWVVKVLGGDMVQIEDSEGAVSTIHLRNLRFRY